MGVFQNPPLGRKYLKNTLLLEILKFYFEKPGKTEKFRLIYLDLALIKLD